MNQDAQNYWNSYWGEKEKPASVSAWMFGATPDELAQLVVEGKKTATCSGHLFYEMENEPLPTTDDYSVVLNSKDQPVAIIKTVEVSLVPMNEVKEEFALAEGEGTYEEWKSIHVEYFTKALEVYTLPFSEDMLLVCERFKLIDVKGVTKMIETKKFEQELERYLEDKFPSLSDETIQEMVHQIGTTDSYVRDSLIYMSFAKLIRSNRLDDEKMQSLLETVLGDDKLNYRLGESGTDSVFTRSFSSLVVAAILETNVDRNSLSSDAVLRTSERLIRYMMEEKDTRGYVDIKGWAHAIAHGADALDALAKQQGITKESINQILESIHHALFMPVDYLDEEEDRLAMIVVSLLSFQDVETEVSVWLERMITDVDSRMKETNGSIDAYHTQRTVKSFLKSTYIILNSKGMNRKVNKTIFKVLEKWMYLL